jgi:hypothetical protein
MQWAEETRGRGEAEGEGSERVSDHQSDEGAGDSSRDLYPGDLCHRTQAEERQGRLPPSGPPADAPWRDLANYGWDLSNKTLRQSDTQSTTGKKQLWRHEEFCKVSRAGDTPDNRNSLLNFIQVLESEASGCSDI